MTATPPTVGYQNIITATNISADTALADHPPSALANPMTADSWRGNLQDVDITVDAGSPVSVDYFGIAGHNLYLFGGTVSLYGNTEEGVTDSAELVGYAEIGETGIPVGDLAANNKTYRYWTIRYLPDLLSDADADYIEIGAIFIGESMQFERCIQGEFSPPQYNRVTQKTSHRSESGQMLGTTIRQQALEGSLSANLMTADWCRGTFQPFVLHAREKPFFLWWNHGTYPAELAFCQVEKDISWSYTGENKRASTSFVFNCLGYYE